MSRSRILDLIANLQERIEVLEDINGIKKEKYFITCKLFGRLGNQLFEISNVLSFCKKRNMIPVFPEMETYEHSIKYRNNIFDKLNTSENVNFDCVYKEKDFSYNEITFSLQKNTKFEGYYQSEKYFAEYRDLILDTFRPNINIKNYILSKYNEKLKSSTSIHIRQGDYLIIKKCYHNLLETDYYKNALEKITTENILVFSDNIEKVKSNKIFKDNRITFIEGETEIIDFYLMSMCQHNIIGNSTFSWWAAWLNENKEKIIYYPEKWFGPELSYLNTKDLIPEGWNVLKC